MREALQQRVGERAVFCGTVARFGTKHAYRGPDLETIMLINITDENGTVVADHLWFTVGKQFAALRLLEAEVIEFRATVTPYEKGYFGYREDVIKIAETDYRLSRPSNVRIVKGVPVFSI